MSTVEPPPSEGAAGRDPTDRQLSRLFRSVPEPAPLSEFSRRRVASRLRRPSRSRARLFIVRFVAVGVLIGVGSAAAAQWTALHWVQASRQLVTRSVRPPEPSLVPQPSLPRAPRVPAAPESETSTADVIDPSASASAFVSPTPGPVQSSALGREAASLEAALTSLRGGSPGRASQALRQLDEHAKKFPGGTLELEARVARVDALLMLGRRHDARRELSTLPIERVGRKQELRLIRAELRADDDCTAALVDFDVLVEQALPTGLAERALFGRGACRLRSGDPAGADRDFRRYLERFPDGRFAASIRAQDDR